MNVTVTALFSLIKTALGKESAPIDEQVDWNALYYAASHNRITTLIYYGIKACNANIPENIRKKFENNLYKSTLLSTVNDYEISNVIKKFEEKNIFYAPLKGLVVRKYYPSEDMRTVGDADILVKESDIKEISNILISLGFVFDHESSHEYTWKKNLLILELHKCFTGDNIKEFYDYYSNTERFLFSANSRGLHEMSAEDLFVYLVVHIAKHYRTGGIGLRHFIDLYVLLDSKNSLNEDYIVKELEKLGLQKFYNNIKRLFDCWFGLADYDDISKVMTKKIFGSGMFGDSKDRFIADSMIHPISKRVLFNIFLPYKHMKLKYPILVKQAFLLPLFWIIRIFDIVFTKNYKIKQYKKTLSAANDKEFNKFNEDLKLVGLK